MRAVVEQNVCKKVRVETTGEQGDYYGHVTVVK